MVDFDALVVGAGPAGSTVAEGLARASLRVALLEEHAQVGLPDHCSGLVSPRTLELAGLDEGAVALRRFSRARVWGPGGGSLWLESDSVQAIAIARDRFDQILAGRAVEAGAELMLATRAVGFERARDRICVRARTPHGLLELRAPLLVGADGATSQVARWLGRTGHGEVIPAVKAEVSFHGRGSEAVEILVGNDLAPGWFGWLIPVGDGKARIGLGATRPQPAAWDAFLELLRQRFGPFSLDGVRKAPIPLGPARDFVADGVLLVGAAARQTKPTTGGGLYLALRAAHLAAEAAARALQAGDCSRRRLVAYEQAWHRLEGREVAVGGWLRRAFRRLSDRELDWILATAREPWAQAAVARLGDVDFPSQLLAALLHGAARRFGLPRQRGIPGLVREVVR